MDNKSELFDLQREKQELDQFLSTIADPEIPVAQPLKGAVPANEPRPLEKITKVFQNVESESPKPKPLASVEKPEETFRQIVPKDKPQASSDKAFISKGVETAPVRPPLTDADLKPKVTSSFLPGDEEKNQFTSTIKSAPGVKSIESLKAMPRFGGSSYFEEKEAPEPPPVSEKKVVQEAEPEKKAEPTAPYDFSPEKKKTGKGKLIGVLLVVIIALLAVFFWLSSGKETLINAGKSLFTSSASDVNLINVRQRLVHNVKLGKSIRVIEGIAENASPKVISNIKVSGILYDASGSKLATMESFGGNILIDAKLETLDANAIKSALETGKGAQDKIPPKGQIPFMIVFADEPTNVFKMSVTVVDFVKH